MRKRSSTILFVDDEPNILEVLKRLFKKEKYEILTASSGAEGLRILGESQVNLVVSDQQMPGMLGTEFLRRVKGGHPQVLTAVLTGQADLETIKEAVNRGHVHRFFLKPWNGEELRNGVREMFYEYESRDLAKVFEKRLIQNVLALRKRDMLRASELADRQLADSNRYEASLDFPLAILEDLPLPIIGVSLEKTMVIANREARSLMRQEAKAIGGRKVAEVLPVDPVSIEKKIEESIRAGSRKSLEKCMVSGKAYTIDVVPLGGKQAGLGAYLRFTPAASVGA